MFYAQIFDITVKNDQEDERANDYKMYRRIHRNRESPDGTFL